MNRADDVEILRTERDLYARLIELAAHDNLVPLLDEALALVVSLTGAKKGYIAIDARGGPDVVVGCSSDDVKEIAAQMSTGIIAEALRSKKTVTTASATGDPRFSGMTSVQASRIEAVLCAPIGPRGALYLAGRQSPGPFGDREKAIIETCAKALVPTIDRLRGRTMSDATVDARRKLKASGIIGRSAALARALDALAVAAGVDMNVLLLGESGTGKSAFARALHESSPRASAPFVEINCAAIPETLIEAELFGAEKGAHSAATRKMPGKISSAERGTLLLDEIGDLPQSAQAKLLTFLQSKTYFSLGSTSSIRANVRIVAATNANLEEAVAQKRFREDLYYRLSVLVVHVPPLRERAEDVPLIATEVAATCLETPLALTWAAKAALEHAEWPGNVRELASTVQRGAAFARAAGLDTIDIAHLFPDRMPKANDEGSLSYSDAMRSFQQKFLREAMTACDGNVSEAARRLGLSQSHLHELLRAHGVTRSK